MADLSNDDRFLECLPFILAQECPHPTDWTNPRNFSDDAHDPGGKTFCGIIQREYDQYRKQHMLPTRDVRLLTQEEGYDIYRQTYWMPHCPIMPAGLDLVYFDESVNAGCTEANKVLQRALGISADGLFGPQTVAAVAAIKDVGAVISRFTSCREAVYREMKGFAYFGRGWISRCVAINGDADKMCT